MNRKLSYLLIAVILVIIMVIPASAQVGIGTSTPHASAVLELQATNKGVLFPRVALTGVSDTTTIASPATSLVVYNTATAGGVVPGFYYWSGTAWTGMAGTNVSTMQFAVQDNTTYNGGNGFGVNPTFPTVDNNAAAGFDTTAHNFVVPATGYYSFQAYSTGKANNGGISAGGFSVTLLVSTDGGATWSNLSNAGANLNDCCANPIGANYIGQFNAGDRIRVNVQFCGGCAATSYSLLKASFIGVRLY